MDMWRNNVTCLIENQAYSAFCARILVSPCPCSNMAANTLTFVTHVTSAGYQHGGCQAQTRR
ncbi:hypothetical protein MAR_029380 [Mya arenaria]|uniref:Uncharacterized protein n=1 Tax=Mya arenaria TaxID=6604 RepID=A0ABY7DJ13_MYAAR|nr:hypothetical protein MAR_029380 [Mya arenaria]